MQRPIAQQNNDEQVTAVALPSPAFSVNMRTPTNFAGFDKLRNKIVNKLDAIDGESKLYLQKVFNVIENVLADRSMLTDDNAALREQNNEKRVRVSTRARMVGRAKVMSYEDIIAAQKKRDERQTVRAMSSTAFVVPTAVMLNPISEEILQSRREIVAMGLAQHCSVF